MPYCILFLHLCQEHCSGGSGKIEMSPLGKVEMSPFVPRKPTLLRVLNGMENNKVRGAIHNEHRRVGAIGSHS